MRDWLRLLKRLIILVTMIALVALALTWGNRQLVREDCLERGGTWDAAAETCRDAAPPRAD